MTGWILTRVSLSLSQVYADANTRDLPLLFVDGVFVGTAEDVQYKEEAEQLNAVLGL